MWTGKDGESCSVLRTSLHRSLMSGQVQNHVTAGYQQQQQLSQCLDLSDSFSHSMTKRPRSLLDSQSHRVIEKRRRDRMNNCLADLGQLVADVNDAAGTKHQGAGHQGRIKKTEIIEMAIERIQALQSQLRAMEKRDEDRLLTGFRECRDVAIRYLVDQHGLDAVGPLCTGLLLRLHEHLRNVCRKAGGSHQQTISAAVVEPSVSSDSLNLEMSSGAVDLVWKPVEQIYVKPEAVTPDTAALVDDQIAAVVGASGRLYSSGGSRDSRLLPEAFIRRSLPTADETVDIEQRCFMASNDNTNNDDDEDRRLTYPHTSSERRLHHGLSESSEGSVAVTANGGGFKYKDSIKRRYCSESDGRSWNETASDCSGSSSCNVASVGGAGSTSRVDRGEADVAALRSRATSPDDEERFDEKLPLKVRCSSSSVETKAMNARCCHQASAVGRQTMQSECTPGFVLDRSGTFYRPVYLSMLSPGWYRSETRRRRRSGAAPSAADNGAVDDGDDSDDYGDDMAETATSTSSPRPIKKSAYHPISIPVNFGRSTPIICGCSTAHCYSTMLQQLDISAGVAVGNRWHGPPTVSGLRERL